MGEDDEELNEDDDERVVSALVQEADCAERVVVLKVRVPGETSFAFIAAAAGASGAGTLAREARQAIWGAKLPPGAARQRAREDALRGARLLAIGESELFVDQHGTTRVVRVHDGRVVVTDSEPEAAGRATAFVGAPAQDRKRWEERGLVIARAVADDAVEIHRTEVLRLLDKARAKIERRREAITQDLAKIAQADKIASQAQWLVGEAAKAPRGATEIVVTDWSSGEAIPMVVPLDPAKSAREQVEAMFKRAKRLRLGGKIANERLTQAEAQARGVVAAAEKTKVAPTLTAIDAALHDAKRAAPRDVTLAHVTPSAPGTGKRKQAEAKRTPFRTFFGRSGRKILVGKGAADNDALTQKTARPHDLWLHAKDRTGAHVVVLLDKNQSCPQGDLVDAAHLAAHFSEAREEKVVDVQYTQRRHVRKPKGSAVGAVMVDREKVIVLRVEPETLRALLEREET